MSNYSDSIFTDDPNTPWYKVLKLIPESSKVLDVGCSSGNFGEILEQEKKCTVDGIELDEKDAEIARRKLRKVLTLNVETDDLNKLDTNYDVIYFGDIIEHLVHPAAALRKVKSLLNKKGTVIFSIPNMSHISVRLMLLGGNFEYGNTGLLDKTHLHFYDRDELERVFSEAGYELEHLDWVQRDIPVTLLKKQLQKLGLSPNKTFLDLAKNVDAAAYQYVGKAKPTATPPKPLQRKTISPSIDMFEKHLADIRTSYEKDVNRLQKQHEQNIQNLRKGVSSQEEVIKNYENSLSWKVTKPLRKISKTVKRQK